MEANEAELPHDGTPRAAEAAATRLAHREVARRGGLAALQLGGRTAVSRAITLVGTLFLARLLAPTDFGVYAFAWFWVVVVLAVGDGGIGATLVQQVGEPSRRAMSTVWATQQAIGVGGCALLWLLAPLASPLLPDRASEGPDMVRLMALTLPIVTLRSLPTAMLERQLRFGPLAAAEVTGQFAFYGVAVTMAIFGFGAWSFIGAAFAHAISQTAVVVFASPAHPPIGFDLAEFRRLLSFGLPLQGAVLLTWLRDAFVPWAGAVIGNTATGGYLQLAWRIGLLVSSAEEIVGRVAFPTFARLRGDRRALDRAIAIAAKTSLLLSAPIVLWTVAAAPVLVPFLFGDKWAPAIVPLQLVCLGSLARFPVRVVRQALFALGFPGRGLVISAIALLAMLVFVVPLLALYGLVGAGVGFLIASAVALVGAKLAAAGDAPLPLLDLGRITIEGAAAGLAAALTLIWLSGLPGLIVSAVASATVAVCMSLLFERKEISAVVSLLRTGRRAGRGV